MPQWTAGVIGLSAVLFTWTLVQAAGLQREPRSPPIWEGVYTAEQAERGKTAFLGVCVRCHGSDLSGTTGPSLKGDRFMSAWGGETLNRLFEKIRDTMPPNVTSSLPDTAKLDIVAFILQSNGYPAASRELSPGNSLAAIQILRQGEQAKVQNFSLVHTVGCLVRGDGNQWLLRDSSEPVVTTQDSPGDEALAAAASTPLGSGRFVLLSAAPFDPAAQQGRKVEARGLVYQEGSVALLTLTSLKPVGACLD
jgi:hypothetical protein